MMAFILKAQLWLRRLSAHLHIVASRHSRCYTVSTFSVEASQAQTQGRWCESIPFYIGVSMLLFFLLFAPCSQRHICSDLSCHISITRLFHKVKGSYSSLCQLLSITSRGHICTYPDSRQCYKSCRCRPLLHRRNLRTNTRRQRWGRSLQSQRLRSNNPATRA
jgi:hypothetical protein